MSSINFGISYLLNEKLNILEKDLKYCNKAIAQLPKGSLIVVEKGKHFEYYHYCDNKKKYLNQEQKSLIDKLATKVYLKNYKRYATNEISAIKAYNEIRNNNVLSPSEYLSCHPGISEIVSPKLFNGPTNLVEWANLPYNQVGFYDENLCIRTAQGHYVRSKSECIIANALLSYGITYRYEYPIEIDGEKYLPDFLIYKANGQLIIWEHLGMLDDEEYRKRAAVKISNYIKAGFIPGVNLIITADDKNGRVIDSYKVHKLIEATFQI